MNPNRKNMIKERHLHFVGCRFYANYHNSNNRGIFLKIVEKQGFFIFCAIKTFKKFDKNY